MQRTLRGENIGTEDFEAILANNYQGCYGVCEKISPVLDTQPNPKAPMTELLFSMAKG